MRFHHIGYACNNLETETRYLNLLGYTQESEDFIDHQQGIQGRFFYSPSAPRIELLTQLEGKRVLEPWLNNGVKMYHLAYTVSNMSQSIESLKQQRAKLVVQPMPATAFAGGGGGICFFMLPNLLLIELIEA
jgi:methylmalonyl-CoA/ethylmalonyl-CoA epimerase